MVVCLSHCRHTTNSSVQSIPDLQQNTFTILLPLIIPKAQFFDSFSSEKRLTLRVPLTLHLLALLEAVKLNGKFCTAQ